MEQPLNQILFGPPGTGKTYNTIFKALDILEPRPDNKKWEDVPQGTTPDAHREKALQEFNKLKDDGRIVFTTFHQSMNYEDFIEGIKPVTNEGQVEYKTEDGIFCQIAKKAHVAHITGVSNTFRSKFDDFINTITDKLSNGNKVVFKSKNKKNQEIARVDGDTIRFSATNGGIDVHFVTFEKLKKLDDAKYDPNSSQNINKEIRKIIGGCNSTYYWTILNEINKYKIGNTESSSKSIENWSYSDISLEYKKSLEKGFHIEKGNEYVLIIDEINRGNVANIFGELITLIEDDKRIGNPEGIKVTLPYSKEKFGVPNNLYIIGTMNTADRSVEALDSALRRRFTFEEMMPKPELLKSVTIDGVGYVDAKGKKHENNATLADFLYTINKRIEVLKDREHQIGHSYFMQFVDNQSKTIQADALKDVIYKKVIPLLQEYFYGDYEKMQLVLGKGFIEVVNTNPTFPKDLSYSTEANHYEIKKDTSFTDALNNMDLMQCP